MTEPKKEKPAKYVITDKGVKNAVKALKEENKRLNDKLEGAVKAWTEFKAVETTNVFVIDEILKSLKFQKWVLFGLIGFHIGFYFSYWNIF